MLDFLKYSYICGVEIDIWIEIEIENENEIVVEIEVRATSDERRGTNDERMIRGWGGDFD